MAVYTTIDDAGSYFNPKIYTGNGTAIGSGGNALTGVGFQPDFTWIKNRDVTDFHVLTDAVRGVTKYIKSNNNDAEVTNAESLTGFDADGFTVGDMNEVNTNTEAFVAWNWKAGTTSGIAGSPSITPTSYSFNATSGFSTITYDGTGSAATLPHGLGVAPKAVIVKRLDVATDWQVYHETVGATEYLRLDDNMAPATSSTVWNDTAPTSTLFSIGTASEVNNSSGNYVAYCFAGKQGYSKFDGYTGNGDVDGAFIYTGFRPAMFIVKETSGTQGWTMIDNKRSPFNPTDGTLHPSGTAAEDTSSDFFVDLLSNGFKIRDTDTVFNGDGQTYVYFAWAESPLVNSKGVPTNAR